MGDVIDGKKIAAELLNSVREKLKALVPKYGRPKLVSLVAGDDKQAEIYINVQKRTAESIGIDFEIMRFEKDAKQDELIRRVGELNGDKSVTCVIVQHPMPKGLDHYKIVSAITPLKDAEGVHPLNLGKIFRRDADLVPCTPGAVMKILSAEGVDLYGKDVVILGHSPIVGKPLSLMILNETATTSVCHIGTAQKGDILSYTKKADILIVAVGKPEMVKADWVKDGVVIVDVGINNLNSKIVGDVDFEGVSKKASKITPVPGGVGPVTVSILMRNVLRAYRMQYGEIQG